MPDPVQFDPLDGRPVVIIGSRQGRPNLPSSDCPFCPGGLEAPEDYDTRTFVNRWPPLGEGRAEVVLYTPHHEGSMWSLGVDQVEKVVALWEDRTSELGSRDDVSYVLVFENRGSKVGATISHPHGQIYAFADVPPLARTELEMPSCALCKVDPGEQLVSESGEWRAWVPSTASYPYELVFAPRSHLGDLVDAGEYRRDLATVLVDALHRLDAVHNEEMPYMMWIHQRPSKGDWPNAHAHIHIVGIHRAPGVQRFVAAAELGSGVFFNPVVPAEAAERLRNAL